MTTRKPHVEIITTDAGVHCAIVGGNGEKVWTTEVYTDNRTATEAIGLLSEIQDFTVRYVEQRTVTEDTGQDQLPTADESGES